MKFGDKTTLDITAVDKKGRGMAKAGTRDARVFFAGPGDVVEASLMKRMQGSLIFAKERLITPSPSRTTPRCAYAGSCGGCVWQEFDYAAQLEWKRGLVVAAFKNAGIDIDVPPVIPAADHYFYRNRMDYCVGPKGELGLKRPGRWNAYLDLQECHLLSPDAVKAMHAFREWMRESGAQPWNANAHRGFVRYLVIREGKRTSQRMLTVVTSEGELPQKEKLIAALAPFATTIYHGVNATITDLSTPERLELLHGQEYLEEIVDGKTFSIHPNAFFQTNTVMAEKLLGIVAGMLPSSLDTLLDLYCGAGFFTVGLAGRARRTVGIEIDAHAIDMARINAERNVVAAEFQAIPSESLTWGFEKPDAVIVDPPRSGLHPKVARALALQAPQTLIYVSCNYESFARDFALLKNVYTIESIAALDLFPHGPHVEVVAKLVRSSTPGNLSPYAL